MTLDDRPPGELRRATATEAEATARGHERGAERHERNARLLEHHGARHAAAIERWRADEQRHRAVAVRAASVVRPIARGDR
jgi:hypothetical protein